MSLYAQDTIINRNVTVEREFKPVIQDAGKINSSPEILEQTVPKTNPTYSDFNLPLNVDFNIHTLPAADLQMDKPQFKNGFARIGFGNNFNTLADFEYPLIQSAKTRLDFSLNHLGTFDAKAHSITKANLLFDQQFDSFGFFAGLGGGHEYLKYYGNNFNRNGTVVRLDSLSTNYPSANYIEQNLVRVTRNAQVFSLNSLANDSLSETFWRFHAFAGIRSLPTTDELRYQAQIQYNAFSSLNGLTEDVIRTTAGFNTASKQNRLGIDAEIQNLFYHSAHPTLLNFWDTYTVVSVNPYYSIERDEWNLRLGAKSAFSFVHGMPLNPSADISGEWKAIPKIFSIYGGITGDYHVNTMNEMFAENRYLFPDVRVQDTYSPFEFYAGIKLKPLYNLLIDGFVDYKHINNQYFFVNKEYAISNATSALPSADSTLYTNRFNVIYSAANLLKIGVRANYNFHDKLNIEFKGAYNKWTVATEQFAWNKPAVEAELNANYHITNDFSFNFTTFFDGERYAKLGNVAVKMNPKIDINLGASYTYNTWLSVFAKVNNLINNSYQDFYGYDVQGFNVLVGAGFSF